MAYAPSVRGLSKSILVAIVVLLGLLSAADPALAQRGTARVQGRVTDETGEPIEGVSVVAFNAEMTPSTITATTSENGKWAILGLSANDVWLLTFSKEGYVSHELSASVSGLRRNEDMDITLAAASDNTGAGGIDEGTEGIELLRAGNEAMNAGDPVTAAAKFEEFLALNPDIHLVYGNLGNAYRDAGEPEKARAAYEKVLAVEPANTMASYNVGQLLVDAGDIQGAMPYFETVLSTSPDDPSVYYNIAELYFSQRQMEQAIQYYQRALEVDPEYFSAYAQLGFANVNAGGVPAAIAAFEKYVEIAPQDDPLLPVIKDVLAALKGGTI